MICDGLTTAARELSGMEGWIEERVGDVPGCAGRIDRCGDCRVKCEDGCGFGGCVTAEFSLPKGCYATILRSRVCVGVMCRGLIILDSDGFCCFQKMPKGSGHGRGLKVRRSTLVYKQ